MRLVLKNCLPGALAISLAIVSFHAVSAGNVYRWMDDRGNPVHSDRPPPKGVPYEVISTESSMVRKINEAEAASEGATSAATAGDAEDAAGKSAAEAHRQQPAVEKNPKYCEQAKQNLQTLDTAPRIRIQDAGGEYRFLTDEEREIHKKNAMDNIKVHCE